MTNTAGTRFAPFWADCRVTSSCIFTDCAYEVFIAYYLSICIQIHVYAYVSLVGDDKQPGEGLDVCHRYFAKRGNCLMCGGISLVILSCLQYRRSQLDELDPGPGWTQTRNNRLLLLVSQPNLCVYCLRQIRPEWHAAAVTLGVSEATRSGSACVHGQGVSAAGHTARQCLLAAFGPRSGAHASFPDT